LRCEWQSNQYTDILIRIRPPDEAAGAYPIEADLDDGSRFDGGKLRVDMQKLLATILDLQAYGPGLFDALFSGRVRTAYDKVTGRAEAEAGGRVRAFRLSHEDSR
jgi:hypothetical protein